MAWYGVLPMPPFQSTPPLEGRLGPSGSIPAPSSFNPRPRLRGDPRCRWPSCSPKCFNPRPRLRGDTMDADLYIGRLTVSIHAPA